MTIGRAVIGTLICINGHHCGHSHQLGKLANGVEILNTHIQISFRMVIVEYIREQIDPISNQIECFSRQH
jgi:hypothetical protein